MPRTVEEILEDADQLAGRFDAHEPDPESIRHAVALGDVRHAFLARAETERQLSEAVAAAHDQGHSWASIGAMVGTSGEAARQRYGHADPKR